VSPIEDSIANWLRSAEPEGTLLRVWPMGGGISSAMTAFTFSRDDEEHTLVLRQPNDWSLTNVPDLVADEFSRLDTLHRGGLPVPAPVFRDTTGVHFGRPGLVLEYIEGSPELNPQDRSSYLDQFARQLADIHHFDAMSPGLSLAETTTHEAAVSQDTTMPQADPELQLARIREVLAAHASVPSTNARALLHGDFWPGNTLWRRGTLVAVIDWEEAEAGDPLRDLSISRLDICWVCGRRAMATFTQRYLSYNPIDVSLLPLWDLRAALRPAAEFSTWAAAYVPLGREDITAEYMRSCHSGFVDQALEALA
jgi:aminoglycoside phosphotransferase (APT) family kinase protein